MSAEAIDESPAEDLPLDARADPVQLQLAEAVRRTWWHQPSITREIADMMVPAYWSRLIPKLSAGGPDQPPDRIECMPADRRWFLELMVLEIGAEGVLVMKVAGGEIPAYRLPPKAVPGPFAPDGTLTPHADHFEFRKSDEFVGKWACVRKHDGLVMTRGQPLTREQCAQWLGSYLKTVGRT